MARSRKTRKVSENAAKRAPRVKKADRKQVEGKKKDSGRKSGNRHNEALLKTQNANNAASASQDPRHGSKKPVSLTLPSSITEPLKPKAKQPKLTDEQKLLKLEEDPRLNKLLDMLEEGRSLSDTDQAWLDQQLDTIEQLMKRLGMDESEPEVETRKPASDDELFDRFESGEDLLNMYKD
ncbi:Der GTPase-activating protein YihI [Shewanella maritima]|uniref:Der GTPase-activating protein YihI n=1 Tax=Shewanella maritima TaxID=2520507 RepID=A0A411PI14_9GAMM|nr:Der GTPase-activating protein YihI [Shewanella maritima]QBF83138.1 Der GTPase-activating protein YihI [Shewanella maritima]